MVALRNARARRYVLLCHFFCFWHFATRTLQFSFLPPNSKLLKDVERNGVPNWIRERMCELGYDENIANKAVETLSTFTMPVLMEMSYEDLASVLTTAKIDERTRQRLVSVVARLCCVLFLVHVRQGLCFCGCFAWFQVQSDVPDNVKAFARALDDAELEGQIFKTETSSFKLQNASEI